VRVDFDRLAEISDGAVAVAFEAVGYTAADVCRGISRIDLDHLAIICDRPVLITCGSEDVAAAQVGA
jgi:hypothetical protein